MWGFMNARKLILAAAVSLSSLTAGGLLVAPVALAEELCPNAASRQGPSAALPDCRAYEQVTPANKGDSQDMFPSQGSSASINDTGYAAEDGERFLLNTPASFAGGDAFFSSYVFSRGAEGWTTTSLSPGAGVHHVQAEVFDPVDLSEVGFEDEQFNHLPGQSEEQVLADSFGSPGGPYTTIGPFPHSISARFAGASTDMSHVVLESEDHELAPGDTGQVGDSEALYEWAGGALGLVNVATNGSLLNPCGAVLGMGRTYGGSTHDAVSEDGSRIIFTAPDPFAEPGNSGCWNRSAIPQENPPQLYMRVDDTTTVEISAPNTGVSDPDGPKPAVYVGASADDSKVFFLGEGDLTAGDTTHAPELYEYDSEAPAGERLVRVSGGESGTAEGNVDFVGAISSDGSTVYFAAYGKLARGASALNEETEGPVNLYRYDTATGKTTYIAAINSTDYPLAPLETTERWFGGRIGSGAGHTAEPALYTAANWYTTANGQYLVFGSDLPLTGYENKHAQGVVKCPILNTGEEEGGPEEERCVELYRYSAADNSIVCVSCAGGSPVDDARFDASYFEVPSGLPTRPISEDGEYVFFDTSNALVSQTTDTASHVYEWHDGKISLISSAEDPANAYFLGSSADGSNVFFGTHAQLVPQDTDVNGDLYDARIDGGFVKVTPPQCTGTGCQGVAAAPPIFATPASVTFEGVGNFPAGTPRTAVKPKAKTLSGAQKLARALKVCRKDRAKPKRAHCEVSARARYAKALKSDKSKKPAGKGN
jgi:hypothetical protein